MRNDIKLMNLEIEANSPHNDGWTRQHYQNELNKKLKSISDKIEWKINDIDCSNE